MQLFDGESFVLLMKIAQIKNIMSGNIILTTGLYDLLKEQIRRKKVTFQEEELITEQLKTATQVLRKDLPEDVVSVNKIVTYKDHNKGEDKTITFVSTDKSKPSKNKISIMSDEGIAMLGHKSGSTVVWPSKKGELKLEILKVETIK